MSHRSAEDIYNDALDLPPVERAPFVAEQSANDPALKREVEELLDIAAQSPDLLDALWPEAREVPETLGKYRILREIGRGAMGRVFLAENRNLPDLKVAIKILPEHVTDPHGIERLHREAVILARLNHLRIATIHDVDEEDGFHYIAMQFVAGETVARRLRRGPLEVGETLQLGVQIAEALQAAHEKGVIHRDLKPLNVMITPEGDAKVLDFGIAKVRELPLPHQPSGEGGPSLTSTLSTTFLGTLDYMSPEQLACGEIDSRTDLWGFGCILYECLTGRQALHRDASGQDMGSMELDWSLLPSGLPPKVARLIRRCLEQEREKRPAAASEVREILATELRRLRVVSPRMAYFAAVAIALVFALAALTLGPRLLQMGREATAGSSGAAPGGFASASYERADRRITLKARDDDQQTIWSLSQIGGVPIGRPDHFLRDSSIPAILPVSADSAIIAVSTREAIGHESIHGVHAQTGRVLWSRDPEAELPIHPEEARWTCAWQAVCGSADTQDRLFAICWREGNHAPTALEFCRPDGSVIAIYYHHGHLFLWSEMDVDRNGDDELLLYGYNNGLLGRLDWITEEAVRRRLAPAVVILLDGPVDGQAYPMDRWPGVPRAAERAYFAIPPYDSVHSPDHDQISCGADMRLLISLKDRRRLEFTPTFEPSHFIMTAWSEEWIRMRDEISSFPVYRIKASQAIRVDVPVRD